jgi:hypothetical protein
METQLLIQFEDPIENPVTPDPPAIPDPPVIPDSPKRPVNIHAKQRYSHVRASVPAKIRFPVPCGSPTPPSEPGFPLPWMEGHE